MDVTLVPAQIQESARVAQLRALFDLPTKFQPLTWSTTLPPDGPWNIGLITGPSGCGKSTVAKTIWPQEMAKSTSLLWPADRALVDAFPSHLGVNEIAELLSSVGFGSPPAWLRPFRVLSAGQQFRVTLAYLLAEAMPNSPIVVDEFSSSVDRTVARIGSAALARAIRLRGLQFVAITCHDDVIDWLQPDWVYRPAENTFSRRSVQSRPAIVLEVCRCSSKVWRLFAPHHYLSHSIVPSAWCFLATWNGQPVAFSAWVAFLGSGPPCRREHRTVTLPDFQGVGMGSALARLIASMWRGLGFRAVSTTTHPGLIQSRCRSPHWVLRRSPALCMTHGDRVTSMRHATTRLTAGFEYIGPSLPAPLAQRLLAA